MEVGCLYWDCCCVSLNLFARIPRIQGGAELTFSGLAQLTSTTNRQVWARPPIDVDFQVLMFTASGLIVRFLKVFEKSNYHSVKWVRYLTKASGTYQIRVSAFAPYAANLSPNRFHSSKPPAEGTPLSFTILLTWNSCVISLFGNDICNILRLRRNRCSDSGATAMTRQKLAPKLTQAAVASWPRLS